MGLTRSAEDTLSARVRQAGRLVSRRTVGRRVSLPALATAVALGSLACSAEQGAAPSTETRSTGTTETAPAVELSTEGTLSTPDQQSNAFTYDPALAPVGARMAVAITASEGSTTVRLDVSGLAPNRGYAAHLHTKPCGTTGADAGPHFQHRIDPAATPEQPSTDPEYANPGNEIWLDFRTDATGSGTSSAEVPFVFTDRVPGSAVVHEEMVTAKGPGEAGTAGDRIACLTLPNT